MAGHSKWANIQHRKGKQDARRGKLFTKLIREITISAKMGGSDIDSNPRLRAAIDNAKSNSMPKDTIDRAIKRGAGGDDAGALEEIRYEGYGPDGTAVMVDCMTDNRNRTVADVRHAFTKCGGNLGRDGSVAFLFKKVGLLSYPTGTSEEKLLEAAMESGAQDLVNNDDGSIDIITDPDQLVETKEALIAGGFDPAASEVTMHPSTWKSLDLDNAQTMLKLLDMLEDLDDVQKVYSNADIPDDILEQLE